MVKEKTLPVYEIDFYGIRLQLRSFVVYVDEDMVNDEFTPDTPHKVPRFEMTRVAVAAAALQEKLIHLEKEDKSNGVWDMYHKACLKELTVETDEKRRAGVQKILEELNKVDR